MVSMSTNVEIPRSNYGDRSQLTNWVLDSGETCHMTPEILDFIIGLLVETDTYIEVANGNYFFTEKKQDKIK